MGTLVAVANHGTVKAYADNPRVELPLREDGKLDVGRCGWTSGTHERGEGPGPAGALHWPDASWSAVNWP